MRKTIIFLLSLVMCFSIASCGSSASTDSSESQQSAEAQESAESSESQQSTVAQESVGSSESQQTVEAEEAAESSEGQQVTEGSTSAEESETTDTIYYSLNDTVETDIVRITVESAAFAIALNDDCAVYQSINDIDTEKYPEHAAVEIYGKIYYECFDENYGLPTEYVQGETYNYVAATGHTLVALTLATENLDRTTVPYVFGGMYVTYNDEMYRNEDAALYALLYKKDGDSWRSLALNSNYIPIAKDVGYYTLSQNEAETIRLYFDIPVEVDSLSDAFILTIPVCTSSGDFELFSFAIN